MNVSLQNIDKVSAQLTVKLEKADYQEKVDKSLKSFRQKAQMPGFRKGMVPMSLVKKMYGKSVIAEEVNKVLQEAVYNYIKENKVNMLGEPLPNEEKQQMIDFDTMEEFEFVFDIALAPEFKAEVSAKDKVDYYTIEVSDEMIDNQVKMYTQRTGKYDKVDAYEDNDMLKGLLAQLDEEGNTKEGGIQVEGAVLMPSYMKNDDQKAIFANAKVNDVLVFNPNVAYDGHAAELGSLLKIDKDHFEDRELVRANHDKMLVAADHLLSLINDVLEVSKLEDGNIELAHQPMSLADVSQEVGTIIGERTAEAGIRFEFQAQELPVVWVYGSPLHLRQIFLNIYGNCIKYNREGGSVTTQVQCLGAAHGRVIYRWTISDTGVGMSREFLKHLFEPFAQEHSDARSVYQGTGLGMTIVRGLVEKMNGTIEVTSREGVGSTFVITLPFEIAPEPEQPAQPAAEGVQSIQGLRLLLVEDNDLNAEIAQTMLEDEGAQVTTAANGKQAVERFQSSPPGTFDAILMDVMMPVMDGLAATRAIRALDRTDAASIPILAMTANAFKEDAEKCFAAGMNAHLTKPLRPEEMVRAIARCCDKEKAQ